MIQFHLYAFVPLGVLLVTACIGVCISAWISLTTHRAPRRSAEILIFPTQRRQLEAAPRVLKAG